MPGRHILSVLFTNPDKAATDMVEAANGGDEIARDWLSPLIRRGLTQTYLRRVRDAAGEVEIKTIVGLDSKAQKFFWKRDLLNSASVSTNAAYAMILVQLINSDRVDRLQRCAAPDCANFFYGARNKAFCSTTCSGRIRGKRHRGRQRDSMGDL